MQVDPKHCVIVIKNNVNSCSISHKEGRSYLKHLCCWPDVFHSIIRISVCAFVPVLCDAGGHYFFSSCDINIFLRTDAKRWRFPVRMLAFYVVQMFDFCK